MAISERDKQRAQESIRLMRKRGDTDRIALALGDLLTAVRFEMISFADLVDIYVPAEFRSARLEINEHE